VTGAVAWETPDGQTGGLMGPKAASAKTGALLDAEVQKIVQKAYVHCKETLTANRKVLDILSEMLIDNENVDARELYTMIKDNVPGAVVPDLEKLPTSLEEMGAREGAIAVAPAA
jgi:ATP-dependent Zn protease